MHEGRRRRHGRPRAPGKHAERRLTPQRHKRSAHPFIAGGRCLEDLLDILGQRKLIRRQKGEV